MKHLRTALIGFETVLAIEAVLAGPDLPHPRRRARRFPLRYLRYWFVRQALEDLQLGRPLNVLEVGIGIAQFAKAERLDVELLTGAFFFRASANPLEEYSWWTRANLAWGALFPSLGGEVYFRCG